MNVFAVLADGSVGLWALADLSDCLWYIIQTVLEVILHSNP